MSRIIHLKAPFLKQLRQFKTPYLLYLKNDFVVGQELVLADSHHRISCIVQSCQSYPPANVPWKVLDSLNYQSRLQLKLQLQRIYHQPNIKEITVLEIVVQS